MKHHMQSIIAPFIVIIAITAGAATIGHLDYEADLLQQRQRQDMEDVWCRDAARGLAPDERAGWPPLKGGCRQ